MKNGWKTVAIIFIVLFALETIFFGWIWSLGLSEINKETECSVNVCGDMNKYDSFYWDTYTGVCYCYKNGEIVYQEFMK